jgi:hypothetical protein
LCFFPIIVLAGFVGSRFTPATLCILSVIDCHFHKKMSHLHSHITPHRCRNTIHVNTPDSQHTASRVRQRAGVPCPAHLMLRHLVTCMRLSQARACVAATPYLAPCCHTLCVGFRRVHASPLHLTPRHFNTHCMYIFQARGRPARAAAPPVRAGASQLAAAARRALPSAPARAPSGEQLAPFVWRRVEVELDPALLACL